MKILSEVTWLSSEKTYNLFRRFETNFKINY